MDNRRFDILVKSLAMGTHRRNVLKGLLGLGGVAATGGMLLESDAQAARRPSPTPKPPSCPGKQFPCAIGCCCPPGLEACGSACCTGESIAAPEPGHTECCDNACCHGTCYGEELCCPTNQTIGEGPPTHYLCDGSNGRACCASGQECCDGVCFDPDAFLCCGDVLYPHSYVCCGGVSIIGNCCEDGDCEPGANCCGNQCCDAPCCGVECCGNGWQCCGDQCYDPAASVCCDGTVLAGVCCPGGEGCEAGQNCCIEGEGASAFTYCTTAPCECDRICSDAGLDCCTINNVFQGCYDASAADACCTAGQCGHYNDFENCLVGVCREFVCSQDTNCGTSPYCCGGECSDSPCVSAECTTSDDCDSRLCCGGACCVDGQLCQIDAQDNYSCINP